MTADTLELLTRRMDSLEGENQRMAASLRSLRLIGAVLIPAVLLTQAWLAARAAPTGETVRARRFVLEDDAGRMTAALEMKGGHPRLVIFNGDKEAVEINGGILSPFMTMTEWDGANEVSRTMMGSGGVGITAKGKGVLRLAAGNLELSPDEKRPGVSGVWITVGGAESLLTMSSPGGTLGLLTGNDGASLTMWTKKKKKEVRLVCDEDGPQIGLKDAAGYELSLGRAALENTKTGAKTMTSAASVRMFDSHGKTIWSAP